IWAGVGEMNPTLPCPTSVGSLGQVRDAQAPNSAALPFKGRWLGNNHQPARYGQRGTKKGWVCLSWPPTGSDARPTGGIASTEVYRITFCPVNGFCRRRTGATGAASAGGHL